VPLHPAPYTLHPQSPYALRPTPYTLHPTPYTLHPTEQAWRVQEDLLERQRQQKTLARAQRHASIVGARQRVHLEKRRAVQSCLEQRQSLAQEAWVARRAEEERAARIKHDIYTREREAVHMKYRQKHVQQLRAVQTYEERVAQEEQERLRHEQVCPDSCPDTLHPTPYTLHLAAARAGYCTCDCYCSCAVLRLRLLLRLLIIGPRYRRPLRRPLHACAPRRHEQEIARLEAEEAELLKQLEHTQNLQKNAYAELEVALEV